MNRHVLITGANGYIGSSLAKALEKNTSFTVKLFTRKDGDITHKDIWQALLKDIDIVFHFAAQTSSSFANNNPHEDLAVNVLPVINLIETCKKHGYSPDVVYAGTVTEFGMTESKPINEQHKDNPITIYDIHKLMAEKYLQYYSNQLGKRAVTLRLANIYGPGPIGNIPDRGIVNMMVIKALKGEPLTIFGTGEYIRDYLYIDDIVNAFIAAARHIDKTKGNYYVTGTGTGTTILQMATLIKNTVKRMTNKETKIRFSPFPKDTSKIELRNFIADTTALQKDTDWKPTISLEEGIEKTVSYFQNL